MSTLSGLLGAEAIALDVPCADWREAVRAAGRLLVDSGAARTPYVEDMVRTVEEHGPYIVIAPGLALAHARPSDAVLRTGMSWLRLAEPVAFGHAKNDPVGLVVGLSATDHEQHQQALVEFATLFADTSTRSRLAGVETATELRELLDTTAGKDHER